MRDDSSLYTGMVSQEGRKAREARAKKRDTKQSKKLTLLPVAEILNEEIAKTRESISQELAGAIHVNMDEQNVKSLVIGLRLADDKIVGLKNRLNNILRERGGDGK